MTATKGTCKLCGTSMSKSGMTRHLDACMAEHEPAGSRGNLFRIRVEDARSPLDGWMSSSAARFEEIDAFLRGIWLECCGHLSAFGNPGKPLRPFDSSVSPDWATLDPTTWTRAPASTRSSASTRS
jgi:hypothetical protein